MKHAILILAHKDFKQLSELIHFFNSQCYIFIHLDKKCAITKEEEEKLARLPNVVGVYRKFAVHWAGFSILRCEFFLLKQALKNCDADYFHLFSGQDYPIKPLDEFLAFHELHKGQEFMDFKNLPALDWEGNSFRRFQYFRPNDWVNARSEKGERFIVKLIKWQMKIGYKRRIPDQFERLYGGSAWFSLTRKGCDVLLDYTKKHPAFYRKLNHTFVPEETYVPTVMVNLMPEESIHNNNYRFVRWRYENGSLPANLSEHHFYKLASNNAFFARKLDYPSCEKLVPLINKYLLQRDPITRSETGCWTHNTFTGYTFDHPLNKGLRRLCKLMQIKDAVDLGCGPGLYVAALRKRGISIMGYDGNPHVTEISSLLLRDEFPCEVADLTENLETDEPFDLVLCLDVCPYIPKQYEEQVILNLVNNSGKYIIMSWATPDQEREGYINRQTNEYVIQKFLEHGFVENIPAKNYLREQASLPWLKDTLFVFQK